MSEQQKCRRCGHAEGEHHGLGCTHWNRIELRTEDAIHTDMTVCGCDYFRMTLDRIINELDESAADIREAISDDSERRKHA